MRIATHIHATCPECGFRVSAITFWSLLQCICDHLDIVHHLYVRHLEANEKV
jgi:hypothetical protein